MTKRYAKITWCDADGNAVCLGLDEVVEMIPGETTQDVVNDAIYQGECDGVDLEKYHPHVEDM